MVVGSRRSSTLRCGDRMKSSNVQPCTAASRRLPRAASIEGNTDMGPNTTYLGGIADNQLSASNAVTSRSVAG